MNARGFCVAAAATVLAAAQPSITQPVSLDREPRHHLLFANDELRVISPQIPAGDTTLEHLHTRDEVTVCIQGSSVRAKPHDGEWGNAGAVCAPGRANVTEYTGNQRSHTVQNVGASTYHLFLVENLRESGWTDYPAVEVPGAKMLRENRSFRIFDAQSGVAQHVHRVPVVVVVVSGVAAAGSKKLDRPGSWTLIPAGETHRIDAQGEAHFLEIEVR